MTIWISHDFYWDAYCVDNDYSWSRYLEMMKQDYQLVHIESLCELPDVDDVDVFRVESERGVQLFALKYSKFIAGNSSSSDHDFELWKVQGTQHQ